MAQLIVIKGPEMGKVFSLDINRVQLSEGVVIALREGDASSPSLRVQFKDEAFLLDAPEKGDSVEVNGEQAQQWTLRHGDLVKMGDSLLLFDDQRGAVPDTDSQLLSTSGLFETQIEVRHSYYPNTQTLLETFTSDGRSHQRLASLYKTANAIQGIFELEPLLEKILEILFEEFSADRGYILLMDRRSRKLRLMASRARPGMERDLTARISRTIVREVLSTRSAVLTKNAMDDERFRSEDSIIGQQIHSAICVPLIHKKETLGLVHLECCVAENVFSESDLEQISKVAMQASIAIKNVTYFERAQEFSRNMLSLSRATQQISSHLVETEIIEEAVDFVCNIFGCTRSSFLVFDASSKEVRMAYSVGIEQEEWDSIRMEVGTGIAGRVVATRKPILIRHPREIPEDLPVFDSPSYRSSSFLAVPVLNHLQDSDEECAGGVICATDKVSGVFTREDQQVLTILASHVAIALSNARLYRELMEQEQEINRWNRELEKRVEQRTEELRSAQGQLVEAQKMEAIGLLAAGVSHEFNNLLTSMFGFAQLADKDEVYREKLVRIVLDQTERGREITESLLSFSKQRPERTEWVDLAEILDQVLQLTETGLENENILVHKNFQSVSKTCVNAGKIQQVFVNIIINARHAIGRDGKIRLELWEENGSIFTLIQDTGAGIAPEHIDRIFEPFYTTKGAFGGSEVPGTGIGLSVCYNIIQEHDGEISVESEQGVGTSFTIRLPIREPLEEKVSVIPSTSLADVEAVETALVVDDEGPIREILVSVLENRVTDVRTASSGEEALSICKEETIDVVFLDVKMRGVFDGFETFDRIESVSPETRVVLVTGRAEDDQLRTYAQRAAGYVRKPFRMEDLYALVEGGKT